MQTSVRIGFWFGVGFLILLVALYFQTMTVARGGYVGVLSVAFFLTIIADLCFIQAFRQGGLLTRCFSVLLLLPTLFVVADLIRRGPHLFR